MPLITCIVPVHNGQRYLGSTLDSILAQDHRPLEILVVDDGSTDESRALAASYGDPVRVLSQTRRGPGSARNAGILAARAEFLAFLDADDLYRTGKLTAQLSQLEDDPELDLCLCTAENFWSPAMHLERARYFASGKPVRATHTFIAMLARRSVFDRVGLLDETRYAGDQVEWFMRAADCGTNVRILNDVLVDRRMHAASLTQSSDVMTSYFELVTGRIARARKSI